MFNNLFKRKNKSMQREDKDQQIKAESPRKSEELKQEAVHFLKQLEQAEGGDKINILNKLGQIYQELGDVELAIQYFEKSLAEKEQFGAAYNGLLILYEIKRREAAKAKNDDEIQKWVNRMDRLIDMSKRVMRSSLS